MKTSCLAALILIPMLGMGNLRANLGDTEARCVAKYGTESDVKDGLGYDAVGDRAATFCVRTPAGALNMRAVFLQGTVAHEEIASSEVTHPLLEAQMKTILYLQSAGLKWEKRNAIFRSDVSGATSGVENWVGSDGTTAKFWVSGKGGNLTGTMELSTKKFADAQAYFDKQDGAN